MVQLVRVDTLPILHERLATLDAGDRQQEVLRGDSRGRLSDEAAKLS
ncbi:MAG: hypothetical protein HY998_01360 [candidate division NC10 bacterium]|nr:hypothetical protein [candidate division NC10 bacterium]